MTAPADAGRLRGPSGHLLHYRAWAAPDARGVLLIAHGLGEHSGRYGLLAEDLAAEGYSVFALDHQGHGPSEGVRGHVESFEHYVEDLEAFRAEITASAGPLPVFLLGHSLGGLIAARYLERYPEAPLRGAVLSAPALGIAVRPPLWKRALARVLERFAPSVSLANELDPGLLSRDEAVVEAYRSDPLVHQRITPRLYGEMVRAMTLAAQQRDRIRVPALLLIVPEADRIVDPGAALEFAGGVPTEVTVRRYPGYYHEALNERGRETVVRDLIDWLRSRTG